MPQHLVLPHALLTRAIKLVRGEEGTPGTHETGASLVDYGSSDGFSAPTPEQQTVTNDGELPGTTLFFSAG